MEAASVMKTPLVVVVAGAIATEARALIDPVSKRRAIGAAMIEHRAIGAAMIEHRVIGGVVVSTITNPWKALARTSPLRVPGISPLPVLDPVVVPDQAGRRVEGAGALEALNPLATRAPFEIDQIEALDPIDPHPIEGD
jgi:hypothetical protein